MIHDYDRLYTFLRPYVDWVFRRSFRRYQVVGREHVPTDGAIIYAPNHVNCLCDAMAILGLDRSAKVFGARADIFRKPREARILRWLKILPISRMRDGVEALRHANSTESEALAALADGVPFCMMPEGRHRPKHSLLPLGKGVFRLALEAQAQMQRPVYIVPVGLEYGDYFHLWDALTIQIGEPINIQSFVAAHPDMDQPHMLLALREELTMRMQQLILWVPDDELYETNFAQLAANPPEPFRRFRPKRVPKALRLTGLVLTFPLFVLCALASMPLWAIWLIVRSRIGDKTFRNSVLYVLQLVLMPLSLWLVWPFWMGVQEWLWQGRQLDLTSAKR